MQATNLRGFQTSVNPTFEAVNLDFMDGIPDFMENFSKISKFKIKISVKVHLPTKATFTGEGGFVLHFVGHNIWVQLTEGNV